MQRRVQKERKFFVLISALLVTLMLLASGCGKSMDETTGPVQFGVEQMTESTAVLGNQETPEDMDPELLPRGNDTQVPSAILTKKESADNESGVFWYIPNAEIEAGVQQMAALYQENLLICGSEWIPDANGTGSNSTFLKLISLETGEVLRRVELAGIGYFDLQVCGDVIALADWEDGDVLFLDQELKVVSEHRVSSDYGTVYVSPDAAKIYSFTPDQGIQITDLSTGETEIRMQDTVYLYVAYRRGDAVTFSYTDRETQLSSYAAIDLSTGEICEIPFAGSYYGIEYVEGNWLAGVEGEIGLYYYGMADQPQSPVSINTNGNITFVADPARLLATLYDDTGAVEMGLFGMDGSYLSGGRIDMPNIFLANNLIRSEADNGYFFLATVGGGKDVLLFWDLSKEMSGGALEMQESELGEKPEGSVVSPKLYDRAEAISEQYGVEILIAELTDENFGDFSAMQELYEENIEEGLTIVEQVLSVYPEGFLEQIRYADVRGIEIHLVGDLTKLDLPEGEINGFTSFDGFAQERSGKGVIGVDITPLDALEQTLHHEIFHLIDNKLALDAGLRSEAVYSEDKWLSLNPESFDYAWNSSELPESIYEEEYDYWFIDLYSRTFPREDRATIMEFAMVGEDGMFVSAPHRQAKLEYLCDCIRDAFDTTGWPEVTVWEETLERSFMYGN